MLIGLMNHPARPVEQEMKRIAQAGFDFVDLTLEPPRAWPAEGRSLERLLAELGLQAIGHTAYYLPIASPLAELRHQARELFRQALETFAEAGIKLVNVHPDPSVRLVPEEEVRMRNAEAVAILAEDAAEHDITLMVENLGGRFSSVENLTPIFEASPRTMFHLDVGHANLALASDEENRVHSLLDAFGDRLAHVHVHDNVGGLDDLHLPLGAGTIDWEAIIRRLKATRWSGTVTIEVFSSEPEYVETSRSLWLEWWEHAS